MGNIFLDELKGREHESATIKTSELIFSQKLLDTCARNVCGNYNKNWTCPPAIGTLDERKRFILGYSNAFVFTTKYDIEDSFDFEGMIESKNKHEALVREIHNSIGDKYPIFGAGGCVYCPVCAYPSPCVSPKNQITSIEASGINVSDLSKSAKIKYNNGEKTITYFGMILF